MRICQHIRAQDTCLRIFGLIDHLVELLVYVVISANEIVEIREDGIEGGRRLRLQLFYHFCKPILQFRKSWKPFITNWSRHAVDHKCLAISPSKLGAKLTMCCEMWQ